VADSGPADGGSAGVDTAGIVERWMGAQLMLERQYFQRLGQQAGRQLRLLSLLEMDALTQLSPDGETVAELAGTLDVAPAMAKAVVERLVRRKLVRRRRGPKGAWTVHRTERADEIIQILVRTQSGLLESVLGRMDPELRQRVLELMRDGALTLSASPRSQQPAPPQDSSTHPADWAI
jgi:DNA-binding MarR family transcriptional regulator